MVKKLSIAVVLMIAGLASAEGTQWHWAYAQNCSNRWNLLKGVAEVNIQGEKFTAKLFDETDSRNVSIVLKGTIKNGKLKVVETEMNTDMGESTFTGTYVSQKIKSAMPWNVTQTINLSDGFSMIGLVRSLQK